MPVRVTVNPDDTVVVTVRGHLDIDSAAGVLDVLDTALHRPVPRIVVDLSGVEFCDSTGLSAFVIGHSRTVQAGGWLRLAAPNEWVGRLLDAVGLGRRLGVHPSVSEALAATGGGVPSVARAPTAGRQRRSLAGC